ncbi:putative spore germination protein GerPB [Robertmurraya siralis]|uniref:Spore germination protein GerPB n=1 Tax=Robertmurraya siralis TaxID=77777 RepID=A0A919WIZ5_9BACI|nr:spore germination protein GerPB [Robertmurraya siralis]PAE20778.1 spore gernimation protein [Bacillus sp. 7504-2]GIN62906.1 putative spore germination protein GerPB [Robertmurraya siralis]
MNFNIQQSIVINNFRIGSLANSCVLQIGSAGIIKPSSHLYNTGGFTEPAPIPLKPEEIETDYLHVPSVPLAPPAGGAGML